MLGKLSTHVLDLTTGRPAAGMRIELWKNDGKHTMLKAVTTNADGRTDGPILPETSVELGEDELVFHVGAWLDAEGHKAAQPRFLDEVPLRFGMSEQDHYHVPLLISPYGYSTYRGS